MKSSTVEIFDVGSMRDSFLWCKIAFSFVHPDVIAIVQQIGRGEGGWDTLMASTCYSTKCSPRFEMS